MAEVALEGGGFGTEGIELPEFGIRGLHFKGWPDALRPPYEA
ncbi:MAG: hypothetical protein U1E73_05275 [Planctomycetota bacterium]